MLTYCINISSFLLIHKIVQYLLIDYIPLLEPSISEFDSFDCLNSLEMDC